MAEQLAAGDAHFVTEDYEAALACYEEVIGADANNTAALVHRSITMMKVGRVEEALTSAKEAVRTQPDCAQAHFVQGRAEFHAGDHAGASVAFKAAAEIEPGSKVFKRWLRKANAELEATGGAAAPTAASSTPAGTPTVTTASQAKAPAPAVPSSMAMPVPIPLASQPKAELFPGYRNEWYQTESHVTLVIFIKKLVKDKCSFEFRPGSFSAELMLPDGSTEYKCGLSFFGEVIPEQCKATVLGTKVELKMLKVCECARACVCARVCARVCVCVRVCARVGAAPGHTALCPRSLLSAISLCFLLHIH